MAATILVNCPQCKKQLSLPESLKGKKIRCKDCGTVFPVEVKPTGIKAAAAPGAAKAAAAKKKAEENDSSPYALMSDEDSAAAVSPKPQAPPPPPPPKKPAAKGKKGQDDEDSNPYDVTETDLSVRCPHCAKEMESEDAIVCLHCGYNTRTRRKADVKRVYDITGQDKFMWLLPGFINVFLILFLIGLDIFFVFGLDSTWEYLDDAVGLTESRTLSKGIRLWFVCGSIYAMYKCGQVVFYRFVQQPIPPEEEKK